MSAKFAVVIKTRNPKREEKYTIPAPDKSMAHTWGEKQAESLGMKDATVEVFTPEAEETKSV